MPPLESSIEAGAVRKLRVMGVPSRKMNGMGHRGWPDRMFLVPGGQPFFIEFKRPGGKVTALQDHTISMLRSLGYSVAVCDSVESAVAEVKRAMGTA